MAQKLKCHPSIFYPFVHLIPPQPADKNIGLFSGLLLRIAKSLFSICISQIKTCTTSFLCFFIVFA